MIVSPVSLARGLILVSLLASCAGLNRLNSVSTPNELFVLTPKSTFSPSLPNLTRQIVVEEPTATAAVDTDQIAVQPTMLQVQYLPLARWVDRAPVLVQALLIQSYENSNRVPAVGGSAIGLDADYVIATDMREFQAQLPPDADPGAPLMVHVRLNIKVIDALEDRIIGSRSFSEFQTASSDNVSDVVLAFDEALGDAMRDAIEWSVPLMQAHATEREREKLEIRRPPPRPGVDAEDE